MAAIATEAPRYISAMEFSIASSAHELFHPRAIQLYGRSARLEATTTSRDVYKQWELPKRPVPPPTAAPMPLPFAASTAYHDDFPAHPVQPKVHHEVQPYQGSTAKLEDQSTYRGNFTAHRIEPRAPLPPQALFKNFAKFDAATTSRTAFTAHPIEPRTIAAVQNSYNPTRFDATTETSEVYKAWPLEKRPPPPPPPMRPTLRFEGISTSRELFKGWQLPPHRGSLGIATVGDAFHTLIPAAARAPCSVKQVFTTVHPGQTEVGLLLYVGESQVASRNKMLGQFHLVGLPPAPMGVPQIEVTFHLSADNVFSAEARDLDSGRHHVWTEGGAGAMLATGIAAADLRDGVLPAAA